MNTEHRPRLFLAGLFLAGAVAAAPAAESATPADDLGLTAEQKQKSAAILGERQPALTAALRAASAAKREVFRRAYAEPPDEAAIREASRASAAAEEELAVQRARMTEALRSILTPAQKRKLARAQAEVLTAMEERSKREGSLLDAWVRDHGEAK
ncbi:MAG: periplasmic heavy metal sensor [Lentisphaerae bacterium]|nr:periplasmic heavy metal sensor [Lentisphaerota bacterium]